MMSAGDWLKKKKLLSSMPFYISTIDVIYDVKERECAAIINNE